VAKSGALPDLDGDGDMDLYGANWRVYNEPMAEKA